MLFTDTASLFRMSCVVLCRDRVCAIPGACLVRRQLLERQHQLLVLVPGVVAHVHHQVRGIPACSGYWACTP